ncbi:hypothetical protein ACS3YM_15590 [Nocardia sp. N13]|uniref:hypothetical protein n=1 Tax=Nocardioides sp. N13(2025) TaxID=3453405 RepID=UPI003F776C3A
MSTDIDWQHELDSSFGTGDDVPVGHYVAVGHAAVRRRRAAVSAAGVAAAIVVGTTWALAPGDAPRSDRAPVATEPSATASPSSPVSDPEPATSRPWRKGEPPARALPGGLEIRPGAVVHERRDALYPGKDTESAALDISFAGSRWWLVLEWDKGGSSMSSSRPEDGFADSFDAFVRAEVATGGMTSVPADEVPGMGGGLVTWHGGALDPAAGVEVVERVEDPVPGDESLGLVLRSEGRTTWMLLSQGGAASTWSLDTDSGWLTFDQWLADQVAVQTGSPGVRLVKLAADGTVTATAPSVVVLDQRAGPDLPRYGTGDGPSAVALLQWQGHRWFVLAVGLPDQVAVTTVAASKAPGVETLDEFVAFMADKADEGGMR